MNTVTTINLAGTAFQIEDPGYAALKKYLDDAKAALEGNPDRDEIIADMERAIADKCRACLTAHKNVVTTDEAAKIVADMGPVNGSSEEEGAGGAGAAKASKPKRLYRIVEGEMVAGVANGIAAYFDVDVMLVRLGFVFLLVVTGGGFIFAYLLGWVFIPPAETADQRARAYGAPMNAQEIIDRAKSEYDRFSKRLREDLQTGHSAHLKWKSDRKATRAQMRAEYAWHARQDKLQGHGRPSTIGELLQIIVVVFLLWLGYHHVSFVHDFLNSAWTFFTHTVDAITQTVAQTAAK